MCTDVIQLLRELVSIPSLPGREGEIASFIKERIGEAGVDKVALDAVGNVVAWVKGGGIATLVIEGHMDTVEPGDLKQWHVNPYSGKIIDGYLYGRGAADMKGGIAAQIKLIEQIKELDVDLVFVYTVHEETAEGVAFKAALDYALGGKAPDAVVTGEATELNLAIGQRGRSVVKIDISGKSAHASMPDEGINAIEASFSFLNLMRIYRNQLPRHELLGKETATVTTIECSPSHLPQLPDKCVMYVDHRTIPGRSAEDLIAEYGEICRKLTGSGECTGCLSAIEKVTLITWRGTELEGLQFFPGWVNNDYVLIKEALRQLKNVYADARRYVWRFSTDLVYSSGVIGVPGFGLGPGSEFQAHKPDERVSVLEVRKAVTEYSALISVLNKELPMKKGRKE